MGERFREFRECPEGKESKEKKTDKRNSKTICSGKVLRIDNETAKELIALCRAIFLNT